MMPDPAHGGMPQLSVSQRLRTILLYGTICGLGLYLIVYGMEADAWMIVQFIAISMFYVTVMGGVQEMALRLLVRRIPIVSKRAVGIHALLQGMATLLSFLLATLAIHEIFGFDFVSSRGSMIVIGLVAFIASLTANGAYYLELFHRRLREAERSALQAELGTLRAQINPHFLFNSLNSIAALIRIDPAEAERVTESLADLFRYSLRSSQRPTVRLAEEIESVAIYLEIERARFRDRMQTTIDIPGELDVALTPSLMLQPLVENSVKHGVGAVAGECTIMVRGELVDGMVRITVSDTGPGFAGLDADDALKRGNGLRNVRDRLHLQFGGDAELTIMPDGVALSFPYLTGVLPRHDGYIIEPEK